MLSAFFRRLREWLARPVPCEDCGAPDARFVPNEEAYLCDRCSGRIV